MAYLGETFDASSVEPGNQSFDLLPVGWYTCAITESALKMTKAATGQYIALTFSILTGPATGRKVWGTLNLRNPSPEAERIGRQQLGDLLRAIGIPALSDTDELIGRETDVKVGVQPAKDQFEAKNVPKGYRAIQGSAAPSVGTGSMFPTPPASAASPAPTAAPAAPSATPPWLRQ